MYTLMRGIARFKVVRQCVTAMRRIVQKQRLNRLLHDCELRKKDSVFFNLNVASFSSTLKTDGVAFGLTLPGASTNAMLAWSATQTCYADREPTLGFELKDKSRAEEKLGKPILLAQYFNTTLLCPEISKLACDPVLLTIAAKYLGSAPCFVGANLWWTFPVRATEADRNRHAHLFHRDVDDFRFLKFFFYLTDVDAGEGAHICVVASNHQPLRLKTFDQWNLRRFTDQEVEHCYPPSQIREVCGAAGTGFAEDTLCLHKGSTPVQKARLLLQLQYALYDYGVMHDLRDISELSSFV